MGFRSGLPQPHSSIYLIPLWLAILKQPSPCVPGAHVENDDSDPPKKRGGMRSQKEVRCGIPLFARMTGRYRPHLSLREGLEQPPRSWFFPGGGRGAGLLVGRVNFSVA